MVIRSVLCASLLMLPALALAQSPQQQMFPRGDLCYARNYGPAHLARHPDQRVTRFSISPDLVTAAPALAVELRLDLRGNGGGAFAAYAVCENEGGHTLYCSMEGDAGGFQITPAKNGAILVQVSSLGMTFENEGGFTTLDQNRGDDRSFLLRPTDCR
jgi:hypothetical protein